MGLAITAFAFTWVGFSLAALPVLFDLFKDFPSEDYPRLTRWGIYGFSLLIFLAFAPFIMIHHVIMRIFNNV